MTPDETKALASTLADVVTHWSETTRHGLFTKEEFRVLIEPVLLAHIVHAQNQTLFPCPQPNLN